MSEEADDRNVYSYARVVKQYQLSRVIPAHILKNYVKSLLQYTGVDTICEIGFGTGSTLIPFSQHVPCIGIDSSAAMCEAVRARVGSTCTILQANGEQTKELVGEQKLIHMKAVTHLQDDPYGFIDAVASALAPGGYLAVGREVSQPETEIENLGQYGAVVDMEMLAFYQSYFRLRTEHGVPYIRARMPAGCLKELKSYAIEIGLKHVHTFTTATWSKQLCLNEIIEAMRLGTFSAFAYGVSAEKRTAITKDLTTICEHRGIDLDVRRSYAARLECLIFQK